MPSSILLKNATILVPASEQADDVVALRHHSLLIEDNKIAQIASEITPPLSETKVLDCTGKIVSPGFIDTHHHVWQTQLKGRHANHTLLEYMPTGNLQQVHYTPEDIFWGQLGGCLEMLDAGTTTVVDHAHMNISPAHSTNGLEATMASGIRSVFCYTPTAKLKAWAPEFVPASDMLADWVLKQLDELGAAAPWGDGRVQLGLAFDGFYLPKDVVLRLFERARKAGVKLITAHYVQGYFSNYGVLGRNVLLSHATNLTESDVKKLAKSKAWISSTPDTELQMGHGNPVCFREDCADRTSLGIDCHSNNSSDIMTQMRLALQYERAIQNEKSFVQGKLFRSLNLSVQDAFRLGTIQGARAIRMEDKVGSIKKGKLADLVIFNGRSPGMACAAEQDPVAAIVLHSSIRDVDTVIVDGQIRKQHGNLVPVNISPQLDGVKIPNQRADWEKVVQELLSSRKRIETAIEQAGANDYEHLILFLQKYINHGLISPRRSASLQPRAISSAPAFSSRAPLSTKPDQTTQEDTVHVEQHVAGFRELGLGPKTKIFLIVILSVFGTLETWFWCETIYHWWKGDRTKA
ncbi:hypothetical protein BDV59DRAFT_192088 [Aspergillus ambiguus]|uniref:putative chlorohydrolase family protein n=1 Tax=Aspergillus ambiguus TaxID=176160 RepID=UPI003CCD685C